MELYCHADGLVAEALLHQPADEAAILQGLSVKSDSYLPAVAAALLAGQQGTIAAIDGLIGLLDDDAVSAIAARWGLGQLPADQVIAPLQAVFTETASIDQRENAFVALAMHAAKGADLTAFALERLADELARAASGRSGLCEQALRLLAIQGYAELDSKAQHVIAQDSFADRFEIQRMVKAVSNDGRDQASIDDLLKAWTEIDELADLLVTAEHEADDAIEDTEQVESVGNAEPGDIAPDSMVDAAMAGEEDSSGEGEAEPGENADGADAADDDIVVIDWEAFLASDTAAAMDPQDVQVVSQFGPMLDQLCQQATGRSLAQLQGEELAGLLLRAAAGTPTANGPPHSVHPRLMPLPS